MDTQGKEKSVETIKVSAISEIEFTCNYPQDNPTDYVDSITDALAYIGLFDGIKGDLCEGDNNNK